ncbi:MAG: 2'-5' RNA ligase [Paracoccaceae bacterium]|jgi:2'-5' RNA ligase
MIRAFVALRPDEAVCAWLEDLGADLDDGLPTPHENLHVTLAFLGSHDRHVLEDVASELDRIRIPAPVLAFRGVGMFGRKRPRSAHALVVPDPGLTALHDAVRRAAQAGGVPLERRRFMPHATVTRFSTEAPAEDDLSRWIAEHADFAAYGAPVAAFSLWRSDLTRAGAVYTEAMRFSPAG